MLALTYLVPVRKYLFTMANNICIYYRASIVNIFKMLVLVLITRNLVMTMMTTLPVVKCFGT
jgi:hypothetical protein